MTRDEIVAEMNRLGVRHDEIRKTLSTPGWALIREWYKEQRELSLIGLADQVLRGDELRVATAARIQVSAELEDPDAILRELRDRVQVLKQQLRSIS